MAFDPRHFPLNGNGSPESKIGRLEAHVFHLWQTVEGLKQAQEESRKDREALIRYVGFRAVLLIAFVVGVLASGASDRATLVQQLWGLIV